LLDLAGRKWAIPPCFWRKPAENQQANACWKCYKNTKILQKIFVSENQNFLTFRKTNNMLKESYSRA
jgi:hypothetical protein